MIYCDNAATTKISDEVLEEMMPYLRENFGNPSSLYSLGYKNKKVIEQARERVAVAINAKPSEIFFTSGATESNNWVLNGVNSSHIITSAFEHPSIMNTCKALENGHRFVSYAKPDTDGIIHVEDIEKEITCNTKLISIMAVNNEIGTIQPIKEIGKMCKDNRIYFHTDATQAIGHIPIDVEEMNIDLMSFSGHKFHAPKGIGVLYIREELQSQNKIIPYLYGGSQENNYRAGTENVASIVGLGKAIQIATENLYKQELIRDKRNDLIRLLFYIDNIKLNGSYDKRIANNVNVCIEDCDAEMLLMYLDTQGICASSGSACHTTSLEPSQTLKAIGLNNKQAFESIRFSLSEDVTDEEINYIADSVYMGVARLRGGL